MNEIKKETRSAAGPVLMDMTVYVKNIKNIFSPSLSHIFRMGLTLNLPLMPLNSEVTSLLWPSKSSDAFNWSLPSAVSSLFCFLETSPSNILFLCLCNRRIGKDLSNTFSKLEKLTICK